MMECCSLLHYSITPSSAHLRNSVFSIDSAFLHSMKRLLIIFSLAVAVAVQARGASGEYILLVGGPSLHQWEQYKAYPHDHWWANFLHAARLRTEQVRAQLGP